MCRITHVELNEKGEPKSAVIHFEKPSAAKTALMVKITLSLDFLCSG